MRQRHVRLVDGKGGLQILKFQGNVPLAINGVVHVKARRADGRGVDPGATVSHHAQPMVLQDRVIAAACRERGACLFIRNRQRAAAGHRQ